MRAASAIRPYSVPPVAGSKQPIDQPAAVSFVDAFSAFLLEGKKLDSQALERARRAAMSSGDRIDRVLGKLGLLSDTDLALSLAAFLNIPIANLSSIPQAPVLPEVIDADFVRFNRVLPLRVDGSRLEVGTTDPLSDEPLRALSYATDLTVSVQLFLPADFDRALDAVYGGTRPDGSAEVGGTDASEHDLQRLRDLASEAPTIRLVNQIITEAVEQRASDIHVEPTADAVLVRYRIDGVLRLVKSLGMETRAAVTSRIKIMSRLDIAERRLPQDGRTKVAVRGIDIDFRVSTIPTAFGESVVMRILDRSRIRLDFTELGFDQTRIGYFDDLLKQPDGVILVTGPTGSGKTTTLYTALQTLNTAERKLFTVEDPIEYQLKGINQVQVQSSIGLTFPTALRSILRQDPDIIMIGEIRDLETARIAVQASLTGHLVFSTLHTNSAVSTMTRLTDMGIENYLLVSTVKAVTAQRLTRRLCPHCSVPHPNAGYLADDIRRKLKRLSSGAVPDIRQKHGCDLCGGTGFWGRSTISEFLFLDQAIQRLVLATAPETEIEAAAREAGMTTMYEDGLEKVWHGQTTLEEVVRATRSH
ncbi:ATPase, T2SS/T4P/T4SS family [Bradyrhizobium sp. 21]|uniref:GspE/PulE family protein n=1 Tax=Bradyrhizobium sp. 21 TaxID=2782666 RepID=UPI001FF7D2F2|nr:ATPase, T2SS/T4P/T4SS family [Bradyrhizobium sp. 21]MCK1383302.1 Flp pilus assembly complex ATPase component TadA [Bradyrhizobium sp. 21]